MVCPDSTTITECTKVLLDDEACAYCIRELTNFECVAGGVKCLCIIFYYEKTMLISDFTYFIHWSTLTVEVNRYDSFGALSYCLANCFRIYTTCIFIAV